MTTTSSSPSAKRSRLLQLVVCPPTEVSTMWNTVARQMQIADEQREVVIKRSREVQKAAKQAIYGLHREDWIKVTNSLTLCTTVIKELLSVVEKGDATLRQGSLTACIEEFVEAVVYQQYLKDVADAAATIKAGEEELHSISVYPPSPSEVAEFCNVEEYLGGLMDATGEIQRFAILEAARGNYWHLGIARRYVDHVIVQIMKIDFRNGGTLRKKADSLKYTLKRLEDSLYDVSVMGRRTTTTTSEGPLALAPVDGGEE